MKLVNWWGLAVASTVAVVAGVLVGPAAQVDAAMPAWVIQATPNPGGMNGSGLADVSCTSTTSCTAVGNYHNASNVSFTYAERWNGTAWGAVQGTQNPGGSLGSGVSNVSCTSGTACTAVGGYVNASHVPVTYTERWNGTAWAVQATPHPGSMSYLNDVSCTSATACTVVGDYVNASHVQRIFAERWNGTAWALQSTPNPVGAPDSWLTGVSCTSATACTAVGFYVNSSNVSFTFAEQWNGTGWGAIQATPDPAGTHGASLNDVSCTSATACTAVGYYFNASNRYRTFAEQWNGTAWAIQATPNQTSPYGSILTDVSCTSAAACTAVGYYYKPTGHYFSLAEQWNGTLWAIQATSDPNGALESNVSNVSCTSATACTAVGGYVNASHVAYTLAERYS